MVHLTLQLGAAVVMPFGAPRRTGRGGDHRRAHEVRQAAAVLAGLDRLGWAGLASRGAISFGHVGAGANKSEVHPR